MFFESGRIKLGYGSTVAESELTSAILSAAKLSIGQAIEFVIVLDERETPITFGYILETSGKIGSHFHLLFPLDT
jgi:hypothetical protein